MRLRDLPGIVRVRADADGRMMERAGTHEALYHVRIVKDIVAVDLQGNILARGLCRQLLNLRVQAGRQVGIGRVQA